MNSKLSIDGILEGYFTNKINSNGKYSNLRQNISHYDFQDTDGDNQTECYFYFRKEIGMSGVINMTKILCEILGLDFAWYNESDYHWMFDDQGDEIRVELICHISFPTIPESNENI